MLSLSLTIVNCDEFDGDFTIGMIVSTLAAVVVMILMEIMMIMFIMTIAMIVMITRMITRMIAVTVNCHQKLNWEIKTWKV